MCDFHSWLPVLAHMPFLLIKHSFTLSAGRSSSEALVWVVLSVMAPPPTCQPHPPAMHRLMLPPTPTTVTAIREPVSRWRVLRVYSRSVCRRPPDWSMTTTCKTVCGWLPSRLPPPEPQQPPPFRWGWITTHTHHCVSLYTVLCFVCMHIYIWFTTMVIFLHFYPVTIGLQPSLDISQYCLAEV